MTSILLMDLKDLRWAILWTGVVGFVLAFSAIHFDWGLYHSAQKQPLFEAVALIAAYVPLAAMWLGGPSENQATRLATFACLPLPRMRLAFARYAAPLVMQISIMALISMLFKASRSLSF